MQDIVVVNNGLTILSYRSSQCTEQFLMNNYGINSCQQLSLLYSQTSSPFMDILLEKFPCCLSLFIHLTTMLSTVDKFKMMDDVKGKVGEVRVIHQTELCYGTHGRLDQSY